MNIKVIGAAALAAVCVAGCCKNENLLTVNGKSLSRCELDKDVAALMESRKAQIPAEQMEEAKKMFEQILNKADAVNFFVTQEEYVRITFAVKDYWDHDSIKYATDVIKLVK